MAETTGVAHLRDKMQVSPARAVAETEGRLNLTLRERFFEGGEAEA